MSNLRTICKQKGDTLVEVLISIAIVGIVVGGAYALATRSLRQGITASERTQALKLVEGQIEALKYRQQIADKNTDWDVNFTPNSKINNSCLDTTDTSPAPPGNWQPVKNTASVLANNDPNILLSKSDTGFYDGVCVESNKYFVNITLTNDSSPPSHLQANPTYLITVRWEAIGGGQNQSQLYYRF